MADPEQLRILKQGVEAWNAWRWEPGQKPGSKFLKPADLSGADLSRADLSRAYLMEANLSGADLRGANLRKAILSGANLRKAILSGANLRKAILSGANLHEAYLNLADLRGANLTKANLIQATLGKANFTEAKLFQAHLSLAYVFEANLSGANLSGVALTKANLFRANLSRANLSGANFNLADLREANLNGANLRGAHLVHANFSNTDLTNADLTDCRVFGVSAWALKLSPNTKQQNLVITGLGEPEITVDNIEVAQFVYLLLHNEKIRDVIDTIGKKAVLILGRFTPERKAVLDALRDELRRLDYLPILFDFDKPPSRDLTATVSTLANLARFIIADLTDPSSIPYELATVVPHTPVPVQPILLSGMTEFAMFADLRRRYRWVLKTHTYKAPSQLIANLRERVIRPAEDMVLKLQRPKRTARLADRTTPAAAAERA